METKAQIGRNAPPVQYFLETPSRQVIFWYMVVVFLSAPLPSAEPVVSPAQSVLGLDCWGCFSMLLTAESHFHAGIKFVCSLDYSLHTRGCKYNPLKL